MNETIHFWYTFNLKCKTKENTFPLVALPKLVVRISRLVKNWRGRGYVVVGVPRLYHCFTALDLLYSSRRCGPLEQCSWPSVASHHLSLTPCWSLSSRHLFSWAGFRKFLACSCMSINWILAQPHIIGHLQIGRFFYGGLTGLGLTKADRLGSGERLFVTPQATPLVDNHFHNRLKQLVLLLFSDLSISLFYLHFSFF